MRYHADARREFWGDIFETEFGDINAVTLHPGIIIAWHRHQSQDDHIFCLQGEVLVQAIAPNGERAQWYLRCPDDRIVTVTRNFWHGYSSPRGAILIQFNGPGKWDGSDEERMSLEEMPWIL